ncbi:LysR family transcriptional regulator [Pseudoroseomonas wenyumeiae]|uniref:LysR family transcriptional regulator n=1 Tax=Teichococcus wenyumeiae TaxID=2478470 RepID=A0A3A9JTE7_9PROT|nr:LysR family transcriptional regulator [Pseudoroseomonas wenyumeiae]RKK02259.1 LysR family transcriptional regulator [Pseudoroseomonas wenyumeiae]RMI26683.1 LysR family transcriptional regulator [Pseudoroseomonas wenyumeiae]
MTQTDRLPDLNLLRLFVALMEERHVTRAGERLFLSQPAASGGLRRLREHLHDELLVREGQVLRPTPRAEELYAAIAPLLEQMADAIASATPFDPATDHRTFVLGCSDAIAFAVLPPLLARIRSVAPGCSLAIRLGDHHSLPALLTSGEIDVALGYLGDDLPANARMRVLGYSSWVVLRDASTGSVASLDDYCARPHALISARGHLEGNVDALLRSEGRQRRVVLGLSSFSLLAAALPGTELVATVPEYVGRRLAQRGGLLLEAPPIAPSPTATALAWNGSRDRDPGERWFRGEVVSAILELIARGKGKEAA